MKTGESQSIRLHYSSALHYDDVMKRVLVLTILLWFMLALLKGAESPDTQYLRIYSLIAEADQIRGAGQPDLARQKYSQAQAELKQIQTSHPDWNASIVLFRLDYLAEKLRGAGQLAPLTIGDEKQARSVAPTPAGEKDQQIRALVRELQQLKLERSVLESKLKEALSAQPAAIDARELAKAEERVKFLEKERALLQVSLEQGQARQPKLTDPAWIDELRKALADANRKLTDQTEKAAQLARENEILEVRLQSTLKERDSARLLQRENDESKKQSGNTPPVTDIAISAPPRQEPVPSSGPNGSHEIEILRLQAALRSLQAEKANLEKSSKDLEAKLASVSLSGTKSGTGESERLKQVEKERDDLLKKLNETSRQLYDNKARTETVRKEQFDNELSILRARLEVFEARKIPYTPEELALFKEPRLAIAKPDPKAGKKSSREWPKGAGPLVAEAERAWAVKRYDDAEKKFKEILRLDENSVVALGNLAACQIEQNRLSEAETNLKRALSNEADDPHNLSLLGIVKFRQEKLDEALDLLSRSAQINPQDHQTQNYLGITLSQKGQRGPAETALRKAIQLAPGYAGAHHNLAVIYATQQPPFVELARWHYQKALASGHEQNPELEKNIEGGRTSSESK